MCVSSELCHDDGRRHYHTGTSSNRRRLMYARFVSAFEFRIQIARLYSEAEMGAGYVDVYTCILVSLFQSEVKG